MSALQLWLQNHKRNLSQDAIDEALMEYIEHVEKQRDEFMASERKLSDAYIRLREKLSAFDTPTAPTAEQVYAHTEAKLDRLLEQRDELLAWKWSNELNARIGAAIQHACAELPEGFDLHLEIERNAGTVRLYLADADASIDDFGGDDVADYIYNAVNIAIASVKGGAA